MRKNIETMNKRHLQEFEEEKKSKKITSIDVSSMMSWWFIWFSIELFIVFFNLYQSQQAYMLENLSKFIEILMICDDFRIRDWIKSLSKKQLTDLNEKWAGKHDSPVRGIDYKPVLSRKFI